MTYPRAPRPGEPGWRPAVRFRGATLLNERWPSALGCSEPQRCPVCDGELTVADHALHSGGEVFHPGCLPYGEVPPRL